MPTGTHSLGRTSKDQSSSITDFVARVATQGRPDFVAPAERIGTLALTTFLGFYWLILGVLALVRASLS
jgi:hypothetical protein